MYLLLALGAALPCILFPSTVGPPADNGGSLVSTFVVEVWSGSERRVLKVEELELTIHDLAPGVPYHVRIAAMSDGGQGEVCGLKGLAACPNPNPPHLSSLLPLPPLLPPLVVQYVQSHHCHRTAVSASCCGHCGVTTATQYNSLLG